MKQQLYILLLVLVVFLASCNKKIGPGLFNSQTPHQSYEQKLRDANLDRSPMFAKWVNSASRSISDPTKISIPYQESAYFASEDPQAAGLLFSVKSGEQLHFQMITQSTDSTSMFVDLFEYSADSAKSHKHLHALKPGESRFSYPVDEDAMFLLRIQPELLISISYELQITATSSLDNPIALGAKHHIGSFFGDGRDAGTRKHEGVDIFADRYTPAVAAAAGTITRVGINNLGGKVVFMRPDKRPINLYYAHLDSQMVVSGQRVLVGDTIGLVGNTGNAITTAPHLHFGIYTNRGAVDPLPYIRTQKSKPAKIIADIRKLGDTVRVKNGKSVIAGSRIAIIEAATQKGYRLRLPDQRKIVVSETETQSLVKPLKRLQLEGVQRVYKEPDLQSAVIADCKSGTIVSVMGNFNEYYLVQHGNIRGWIKL